MSVIHEGSSAFAAAQNFIINFNSGTRDNSTAARRFEKGGFLDKSSIMKATRDLTMRFPVICSDTISPSVAAMINKAIERNATSTLQLLFASTYLRGKSGAEVLRRFHRNIDDDISMDDYLNIADGLGDAIAKAGGPVPAGGSKFANAVNKFATAFSPMESCVTEAQYVDMMMRSLNDQLVLEDDYSEIVVGNFIIREASDGSYSVVYEIKTVPDREKYEDHSIMGGTDRMKRVRMDDIRANAEAIYNQFNAYANPNNNSNFKQVYGNKGPTSYVFDNMGNVVDSSTGRIANNVNPKDLIANPFTYGQDYITPNTLKPFMDHIHMLQDNRKDITDVLQKMAEYNHDKQIAGSELKIKAANLKAASDKNNIAQQQLDYNKLKDQRDFEYRKQRDDYMDAVQRRNDQFEYFQKQLLDNDVKKCNELVPSLIIIRYNVLDATAMNNVAVEQQFIAGVKAWLYPETSANIINKVSDVFSKNKGKLGWIKATTGEINFMKDFVLGISKAKISAKEDRFTKVSPIWSHLKYRSNKSVLNRLMKNKPNDAGAITTLVISSEEADYLSKELEINLLDVKQAQKIMEAYNFMGIVIVDENFEVARFLFDGAAYFEDIAFSSLEREDKDSSYKKVVNLISKINRG